MPYPPQMPKPLIIEGEKEMARPSDENIQEAIETLAYGIQILKTDDTVETTDAAEVIEVALDYLGVDDKGVKKILQKARKAALLKKVKKQIMSSSDDDD